MTSDPLNLLTPAHARRFLPVLFAFAAFLLVIGVAGTMLVLRVLADDTTTLRGEVHLRGEDNVAGSSTSCYGSGGYDDLREGTGVVVTDAAGTTIAVGSLGRGTYSTFGTLDCVLPFTVEVPTGKGFYGIEVAHRGAVKFAEPDLGRVRLAIGD